MQVKQFMKHRTILWVVAMAALVSSSASAQFEYRASVGPWVALLPDMGAGTSGADGSSSGGINVDQTGVGAQGTFSCFYHFKPTRTMFESDMTVAGVGTMSNNVRVPGSDLGGLTITDLMGNPGLDSAGGPINASFHSEMFYYNKYYGLRDRFSLNRVGLGEVIIGCGASWIYTDQDFFMTATNGNGDKVSFNEDLDTNYLGGEFRGTLFQPIFGRMFALEARYGLYRLDAKYKGTGSVVSDTSTSTHLESNLRKSTSTVSVQLTTTVPVGNWLLRPTVGVQYFDDMAKVIHQANQSARVGTGTAYMINAGLEFLF